MPSQSRERPETETELRLGAWTALAKLRSTYKWLIFLFLLCIYLAAGQWLLERWGTLSRAFVFAFALPAALFWGVRGGVVVALVAPIPVLIIHKAAGIDFAGGPIGPLFLFLITVTIGRMSDLSLRLEEELRRKEQAEEALQRHQAQLEETVQTRTAALTEANTGLQREIGKRERAKAALRTSEEKYRTLIENATDAIYIAQDGLVKFVNPASEKMTGYTFRDLVSMPFTDLIHPDHKAMVLDRHRRRLAGEDLPPTYSFKLLNRQGETLWVELSVVTIQWEGQPATLNFLRDVTAQRRLEEQLLQAQKFQALGTLAGGVAHDFNNLLMGIQGRISLLSQEIAPRGAVKEHIDAIETHIQSAAGLAKQMLGLVRRGKFAVVPLNVNDLIRNSATLFARTRKEIDIQIRLSPDPLVVEADPGQIEQVLLNLYLNAWQAMPRGGELVLKTDEPELDEPFCRLHGIETGRYARITVADTGKGMDSEIQQQIFDPFFTTKEKSRGTGLGLASAYGIVKNHGGIITVASTVGQGAVFEIYLPASEKAARREGPVDQPVIQGSETVLLVDDEPMIIEVGQTMLEKLGYEVIVAGNGENAVKAVRERGETIDLVILDLVMPGIDGGQTFDRIREIQPQIPVMISSGYAEDGEAASILERGGNGFIQKPFNLSQLSVQVRRLLDIARPPTIP